MKPMYLQPVGLGLALLTAAIITNTHAQTADLWALAKKEAGTHRFSTLFTAQDVRRHLSTEEGLNQAMDWCKTNRRHQGLCRVLPRRLHRRKGPRCKTPGINSRRRASWSPAASLTTKVGKPSTGWKDTISCYTDPATQAKVKDIFDLRRRDVRRDHDRRLLVHRLHLSRVRGGPQGAHRHRGRPEITPSPATAGTTTAAS